jgi:uncharacterized membrane protein
MKPITKIFPDDVNVGETERIVSGSIGAALVAMSVRDIKTPTLVTWLKLATGSLLLFRGITGYCPVNAAIGRNSAMPVKEAEETFETLAE